MTETKGFYKTETEEALEMLGNGYGRPSVEIRESQTVIERHSGKLVEVEKSAFIKLYTSFKNELKELGGSELKVWIFLALSVNRNTKDARPGLRKISKETGLSVNTVRICLENLERADLLDVEKESGKGNIYHPADYVSVSKTDTVTVSKTDTTVSKNGGTVSAITRKSAQLEELELTRNGASAPKPDLVDGILKYQRPTMTIITAIEKFWPFNVNWETKTARQWLEWARGEAITPEQIEAAAQVWKMDKKFNWRPPSLKLIFEYWPALMEAIQTKSQTKASEQSLPETPLQRIARQERERAES